MDDAVGLLLDEIARAPATGRADLRRLKTGIAARTGSSLIRNDALLRRYRDEVARGARSSDARVERLLMLNAIRSESGIATVTVITEPYACPGRCVYCPTEARAPKSYLTNEPAVMRALRNDYDPYRQVMSRLATLDETGHATDKIELIIKGGTWSFYPAAYQHEFIQRCMDAANREGSSSLEEAQRLNETAARRIIGITIETRPDYIDEAEIRRLRALGVTRVELGVQSLEESVLALTVRDHGTEAIRHATRLLKDTGFKVAYHLMPNLPGATPESDLASARQLFEDPAYRPDTMKIYPCVVIESAELYQWWRQGRYTPYDDETLLELLIAIKQLVPPWVRIERVIRDIPSTSIRAGCAVTNLREETLRRMRARGLSCRCIRCRQVRGERPSALSLIRREYDASGGREIFLSVEDEARDQLAALLRLRVANGTAWVRELHVYGEHLPLAAHRPGAAQHQGLGKLLLSEAERIAREEFNVTKIAVIAGVGVREYYRRLGYVLEETYMVKSVG